MKCNCVEIRVRPFGTINKTKEKVEGVNVYVSVSYLLRTRNPNSKAPILDSSLCELEIASPEKLPLHLSYGVSFAKSQTYIQTYRHLC